MALGMVRMVRMEPEAAQLHRGAGDNIWKGQDS